MFKSILSFGRRSNRPVIDALYEAIVASARQPHFYSDWGVPDTPLGRFEMLSLHMFLFLRRSRTGNEALAAIAQETVDMFFTEIDQAKLAAGAGIALRPSTLLIFGNPPLGVQFLTANPDSGLDWPVRLLVREDEQGRVWTVYSDFAWIAKRYGIADREAQFRMASQVIASVTSAAAK